MSKSKRNCCVPECNSGLASQTPTDEKISFHKFPRDNELRQKWVSKVHRKNNEETNKP